MSFNQRPSHTSESMTDRKKSRELAEARQSGQVAPQVDVKTGAMINPHNPEFITKRPWYLGSGEDAGPSLDHQQADPNSKSNHTLSMSMADELVKKEREKHNKRRKGSQFQVGMWVEAMRHGKGPYRICQITKIAKKGTVCDLKFEDGTLESKVKFNPSKPAAKPRIRLTQMGTRTIELDEKTHGRETFDSKRDKYHGYDPESHTKKVAEVFAQRDELRKKFRQKEKTEEKDNTNKTKDSGSASDSDAFDSDAGSDSDDEFVQRDEDERVITTRLARQGGVGGAQMKVTARNLRIREDTAKYLRNLDANSAYYDPKSRSMRDNPNPEIPLEESQFAGDNFARISGDAVQLAETQLFAWDATKGAPSSATSELHPQANPSQVEVLKRKYQSKAAKLQHEKKRKVLDKYGGSEYLDGSGGLASAVSEGKKDTEGMSKERKTRFGVSTTAEVYTLDGKAVKGPSAHQRPRTAQKSKYEEDTFINGHTTVWGSYFHVGAFQWGYADDHSLMRSSYCTGATGRQANDEAHEQRYGTGVAGSAALAQARGMLKAMPQGTGQTLSAEAPTNRSRLYGEADPNAKIDKSKVQKALEDMDQKAGQQGGKYNSMNAQVDVTDAEMEAYRLRKERGDDPMAKIGNDELLDYKKK
eukprot:Nitzschia sp. Nitz4//scaffold133_size116822//22229//24157//NITZ4_003796-RA/size116822-processed-gene-0.103-mRNA-1//1//CDS//3329535363//6290//frame0